MSSWGKSREMSITEEEMDMGEIRTLVFEALRNHISGKKLGGDGVFGMSLLVHETQAVAGHRRRIPMPGDDYHRAKIRLPVNQRRVLTVISELFNEGILMWGKSLETREAEPDHISITEYGEKILFGDLTPHDPDGYLKQFKSKVPNADSIVLEYLQESIQCFRHNNLLASSVMLGVASEAAFEKFFESLTNYVTGPDHDKLVKLVDKISTKEKFEKTLEIVDRFKKDFPNELQDSLDIQIRGIFTLIRYQRNESGHPTGNKIVKEELNAYFQLFIMQSTRFYRLIEWMQHESR